MSYVPEAAEIPAALVTAHVQLEPLTVEHNARDYAAVMASADRLRARTDGRWPSLDFSPEENREDLALHEREHRDREAFTFSILSRSSGECVGCLYLRPPARFLERGVVTEGALPPRDHTTMADFWMVPEAVTSGVEADLFEALRVWLREEWPFERVWWITVEADTTQAALFAGAGRRAFVLEGSVDPVVYVGFEG